MTEYKVRRAFLVGGSREAGIRTAKRQPGWDQIAAFRFVTPDRVDVLVIDAVGEFVSAGGPKPLFLGEGFKERRDMVKWERLFAEGVAVIAEDWSDGVPAPVTADPLPPVVGGGPKPVGAKRGPKPRAFKTVDAVEGRLGNGN